MANLELVEAGAEGFNAVALFGFAFADSFGLFGLLLLWFLGWGAGGVALRGGVAADFFVRQHLCSGSATICSFVVCYCLSVFDTRKSKLLSVDFDGLS